MKKIFILLSLCIAFLASCKCEHRGDCNEVVDTKQDDMDYISIRAYMYDYNYYKIVLEGHDYYFRCWATRIGYGSDLVHNPNCKVCKVSVLNKF